MPPNDMDASGHGGQTLSNLDLMVGAHALAAGAVLVSNGRGLDDVGGFTCGLNHA
jgi:hypothetical protein